MTEKEIIQKRQKKKRFFYIKIAIILVVIVGIVSGFSILGEYNGVKLSDDVTVNIPEGSGTKKIASILKENDVIDHTWLFSKSAQLMGYDKKMRNGEFVLSDGMSYRDIMEHLSSTAGESYIKVTIPEGFEVTQIAERLEAEGVITVDEFCDAMKLSYNYQFLENMPEREARLEGYLFPDTYKFRKGADGEEVIKTMLDNFDKHFKDEYYGRADELGMSVDDIITLASIIERETNTDKDRAKVAGVFYNRINGGMRLQSCATVQYALGERKPVLSIADTQIDSPYNTYTNDGLPIGPIASPGQKCIEAALYPESTDAMFFVLDANGNHVFSQTYEEHMAAKSNAAIKVE